MNPDLKVGIIFLQLMLANYIWQALTKRRWAVAAERSFFQGLFAILLWFVR